MFTPTLRRLALIAPAFLWGLALTRSARATFAIVQPPTCPAAVNIPWNYQIGGTSGVFELPQDPNCSAGDCPHYINNLSNLRYFTANAWVGSVKSYAVRFETELNYDFFRFGLAGYAPGSVSGSLS